MLAARHFEHGPAPSQMSACAPSGHPSSGVGSARSAVRDFCDISVSFGRALNVLEAGEGVPLGGVGLCKGLDPQKIDHYRKRAENAVAGHS